LIKLILKNIVRSLLLLICLFFITATLGELIGEYFIYGYNIKATVANYKIISDHEFEDSHYYEITPLESDSNLRDTLHYNMKISAHGKNLGLFHSQVTIGDTVTIKVLTPQHSRLIEWKGNEIVTRGRFHNFWKLIAGLFSLLCALWTLLYIIRSIKRYRNRPID